MKLKKITVSGFKSFVDQTNVRFSAQIVGVVGPNGCGKSNVIDAVRWVMGESSAKLLRGDSMEDVIFNGSSTRKPVGRASVELLFDNSLGRIKGHYHKFSDISVKRILSRDGKSEYRINDKRVRRKDVLDMFRGTGLGPRSYSIIEQGMVSRIVESKPEELRAYVEEAAGISRYKDRRRETENRIRHTRENIERSEDIRGELLAQLRRLKRQAQAAGRYKKLQDKRRDSLAILYRLRFDAYTAQILAGQQSLDQSTNLLEKKLADQREIEARIERRRSGQGEAQDKLSEIQATFYQVGADISRIEQKIEHIKVSKQQDSEALAELNTALAELESQSQKDQAMLAEYQARLDALQPQLQADESSLEGKRQTYEQARIQFDEWQDQFTQYRQQQAASKNQQQLQLSIIDQINRQQSRAEDRESQLGSEQARLNSELEQSGIAPLLENLKNKQAEFDELQVQIESARHAVRNASEDLINLKNKHNEQSAMLGSNQARIKSLQEFQAAALGSQHQDYKQWLSQSKLENNEQLAGLIQIRKGWERAADRILTPLLQALIDQSGQHNFWLKPAEHAVTLISIDRQKQLPASIQLEPLASYIEASSIDISALIAGVYVANDAAQAQQYRLQLNGGERIVTRDGVVYGANWVSHVGTAAANTGYLVREEEMHSLKSRVSEIDQELRRLQNDIEQAQKTEITTRDQVKILQEKQEQFRQIIANDQREITQLNTAQEYTQSRLTSIVKELSEIQAHGQEEHLRLNEAAKTLETVEKVLEDTEQDQASFIEQEAIVKRNIEQTNLSYREQQGAVQTGKLEQTRLETSVASLESGLTRMGQQLAQHKSRKQNLLDNAEGSAAPLEALNINLQVRLSEHKQVETNLTSARDEIAGLDNALREQQSLLSGCIDGVNQARTGLDEIRMALQDRKIRQQSLVDEAARDNCIIDGVELPEDCPDIDNSEQKIEDIERKISSIGAVNLVAIDEYETQSERAEYLEKQHNDLLSALETLEKVIRKIDKETRVRFEETYTLLNKNFSDYFPKLFGGGKASLNLTTDDWLTTGITVLAQPPGKRNSTIHLLSGGEKALTAVSLLFGLFELNPAPFCIMDEVDAPLDDANVDRFCDTLRSLSEHAQIIVITHNKITMQAANNLIGVTMNEPGVSRVVSVDVERAIEMVES